MSIRLAFITFSCLAVVGCHSNNAELKASQLTQIQRNQNVKLLTQTLTIAKEERKNENFQLNNNYQNINLNSQQLNPNNYLEPDLTGIMNNLGNYMTLTSTGKKNNLNNPLYELSFYINGQKTASFETVSGRKHTQNRNRHLSGTEAPLPNGTYTVARNYTRGNVAEVGGRFLPITPQFRTGRTELGIHVDPSYNKNNGEDGTSGCIGMVNTNDLDRLLNYVRNYQPQYINVQI